MTDHNAPDPLFVAILHTTERRGNFQAPVTIAFAITEMTETIRKLIERVKLTSSSDWIEIKPLEDHR